MEFVERVARTKVDGKGRLGLPRSVREEAGLPDRAELTIRVEGPGRVLLLTREAIETELHSSGSGMSVEEFLRWKEQEAEVEEERLGDLLTHLPPSAEAS